MEFEKECQDNVVEEVIEEVYTASAVRRSVEEATEAIASKEEGNQFYRDQKFEQALDCYSRAISQCPDDETNKENLV